MVNIRTLYLTENRIKQNTVEKEITISGSVFRGKSGLTDIDITLKFTSYVKREIQNKIKETLKKDNLNRTHDVLA